MNLVEPRGKSLCQPSRIGEHDGRVVRFDQVDQPRLDVGPDGVVRQVGHIGHRHLHGQLEGLGRRAEPRWWSGPAPDRKRASSSGGRTVADNPMRWAGRPSRQFVEPLQRQRQVRAALAAGDGVNLVDDHGLHPGQGLAGRGGQHQEQRLRGGDQHVGRRGDELAALRGRGVAGSDPHADLGRGQTAPFGDPGEPGQRGAQVALDVDGQRLER